MLTIPNMSHAAFVLSLLILFLVFSSRKQTDTDLSPRSTILLSVLWVMFITAEFWLLGPNSFIHFGDEGAQGFAFLFHSANRSIPGRFDPQALGGTDAFAMFSSGYQMVSIERLMFRFLPGWVVLGLHKIIGASLAVASAYALARRAAPLDRRTALAIAAIFSLIYQWMINVTFVHSFGYSIAPAVLLLLCYDTNREGYWRRVVGAGVLTAVTVSPVQGGMPLYTAILALGLATGAWRYPRFAAGLAFVGGLHLLNWAETLQALAAFSGMSVRVTQFSREFAPFGELQLDKMLIPVTAIAISALACIGRPRDFTAVLVLLLFPAAFGYGLHVMPWERVGLQFLRGLNFIYLFYAVAPLAVVALAKAAHGASFNPLAPLRRAVLPLILALPFAQAAYYKSENSLYWLGSHNYSGLFAIPNLIHRPWLAPNADPVRTVTVPYRFWDNDLLPYGLDTIGGYIVMADGRKGAFWKRAGHITSSGRMMLRIPRDQCQGPVELEKIGDPALLRIANVRYVVSKLPVTGEGLRQVDGPDPATFLRSCDRPLGQRILHFLKERLSPSAAYIYDMGPPAPRAYFARGVIASSSTLDQEEYWQATRQASSKLWVATEAGSELESGPIAGESEVTAIRYGEDRVVIGVAARDGGILVFNTSFSPFWQVRVDGVPAKVEAVNAIQMAVAVPPDAHEVTFHYERPLLFDRMRHRFGNLSEESKQ